MPIRRNWPPDSRFPARSASSPRPTRASATAEARQAAALDMPFNQPQ